MPNSTGLSQTAVAADQQRTASAPIASGPIVSARWRWLAGAAGFAGAAALVDHRRLADSVTTQAAGIARPSSSMGDMQCRAAAVEVQLYRPQGRQKVIGARSAPAHAHVGMIIRDRSPARGIRPSADPATKQPDRLGTSHGAWLPCKCCPGSSDWGSLWGRRAAVSASSEAGWRSGAAPW